MVFFFLNQIFIWIQRPVGTTKSRFQPSKTNFYLRKRHKLKWSEATEAHHDGTSSRNAFSVWMQSTLCCSLIEMCCINAVFSSLFCTIYWLFMSWTPHEILKYKSAGFKVRHKYTKCILVSFVCFLFNVLNIELKEEIHFTLFRNAVMAIFSVIKQVQDIKAQKGPPSLKLCSYIYRTPCIMCHCNTHKNVTIM